MSAFVVSDGTMQKVVTALCEDHESCEDADKLGRDLFRLNEAAVNHRYAACKHVTPQEGKGEGWTWKVSGALRNCHRVPVDRATACAWLKAMHCLKYQLSEGEQFTNTLLFERLSRRIRTFESSIISNLPEYDAAPWSE